MNWRAYAPALLFALTALVLAVGGGLPVAVWLFLVAITVVLQVRELERWYRDDP